MNCWYHFCQRVAFNIHSKEQNHLVQRLGSSLSSLQAFLDFAIERRTSYFYSFYITAFSIVLKYFDLLGQLICQRDSYSSAAAGICIMWLRTRQLDVFFSTSITPGQDLCRIRGYELSQCNLALAASPYSPFSPFLYVSNVATAENGGIK